MLLQKPAKRAKAAAVDNNGNGSAKNKEGAANKSSSAPKNKEAQKNNHSSESAKNNTLTPPETLAAMELDSASSSGRAIKGSGTTMSLPINKRPYSKSEAPTAVAAAAPTTKKCPILNDATTAKPPQPATAPATTGSSRENAEKSTAPPASPPNTC